MFETILVFRIGMRFFVKLIAFILFSTGSFGKSKETTLMLCQQLEDYQKQDKLLEWLDRRNSYFLESPAERLSFLTETEQKAWRKPQTAEEREAWLYLLIYQGYYQLYTGDILQSINKYEQAYQFRQRYEIAIESDEYILKPLTNNYTRIGDYDKAIFLQKQSLQQAMHKKDSSLIASVSGNLALAFLYKKDYTHARSSAQLGLKYVFPGSPVRGLLTAVLAEVYHVQKNDDKAAPLVQRSISFLNQFTETPYWLMSAYTLAGEIYFNLQDYVLSASYYQKALDIHQRHFKTGYKRELANIYTAQSKLALLRQELATATEWASSALRVFIPELKEREIPVQKQLYAENKLQEALLQMAQIKEKSHQLTDALKYSQLAFQVSEELRQEFSYQSSKQQLQSDTRTQAEKIIELAFSLYQTTGQIYYADLILNITEKSKARILNDEIRENQIRNSATDPVLKKKFQLERLLVYYQKRQREEGGTHLQKQIHQLQFQLSNLQKQWQHSMDRSENGSQQVLHKIPENGKTLIFFCGEKAFYRILAKQNKILTIDKIEGAGLLTKDISSFLQTYFYQGPAAMVNRPQTFFKHSYHIYQALFKNLNLQKQEPLLIIRDGILNLLSFESLITQQRFTPSVKKWPFLIKKHPVSYQYSLGILRAKPATVSPAKISGIFVSQNQRNPTVIAAVKQEYQQIKQEINGKFFIGEDGNELHFHQLLKTSDVFHFSSHAYLDPKNQEPILELYDKNFYLFELGGVQHLPKLVVLSACQTADGQLLSGEGVISMSRGFIAAGTQAVISGLWKVNDEAGAGLTINFYRELKQIHNPERALRAAKLSWLRNTTSNLMVLPYYWDSLNYTGNPLEIHTATLNLQLLGMLTAVIVALVLLVYFIRK